MAGRGPAPKEPRKRVGHLSKADRNAFRIVTIHPVPQPRLRDLLGDVSPLTDTAWHEATDRLWDELRDHPATQSLVAAQWSMLARAVMYDDAATKGVVKPAEARLRLASFHIDPADMLRGRIATAQADDAEEKGRRSKTGDAARARRGPLKAAEPLKFTAGGQT